jgi:drug/metabolite transporter (DMT)-like permease
MKRALNRMQPLEIAAGIHAVSVLFLLPGAAWSWPDAHFTALALLAVAVMGVVTSGLAYWAHIRILAEVSPVAAMSPTFMIPVFGVTWGHLFLGEQLGAGIFLGGALVLVACALITGFNPWEKWLDFVDAKL